MTYNIQHGMSYREYLAGRGEVLDFAAIADVIRRLGADAVGLNEVRGKGNRADYADQTEILAELLGWENFYFAEAIRFDGANPYGNALISRYPIINAETIAVPDPTAKDEDAYYETRCILRAELDAGGKPLTVFATHFGLARAEERNSVDTLLGLLANVKTPAVVMGDFNVTPDDELLLPLREALRDTADAMDEPKLSFPSTDPDRKIDYIFATRGIRVASADIPNETASDHRPHVADIEL